MNKAILTFLLFTAIVLVRPCDAIAQESVSINDAVLKISQEREIPSLTSGLILTSSVREGSQINAGDALMQIDSRIPKLDLERLRQEQQMAQEEATTTVELDYARRSLEVSQAELSRALNANNRRAGVVSTSELDQLKLVVQRSIAERDKTEFEIQMKRMLAEVRSVELKIGEKKLSDHQITAPISGIVVEILKKPGEWVEPSEPVARVVQMDKLKTEVKISAAIALDNLTSAAATFTPKLDSLKEKSYTAKVTFVHPEVNPVNELVRVWVEIENPDLDLVPGLIGKLEITLPEGKETTTNTAPESAPKAASK